jgi:hypothetical protein
VWGGAVGCFLWNPEDLISKNVTYTSQNQKHIENDIFIENKKVS